MKKLLLILFLFSTTVYGQIGIGHSVPFWGKTIKTTEVSYQYNRFSVYYFYNYQDEYFNKKNQRYKSKDTSSFAISYRLIKRKHIAIGGIGSLNKFPTSNGMNLNFLLELNIPINRLILSYTNISNGFGLINKHNQGYDSFKVSMLF